MVELEYKNDTTVVFWCRMVALGYARGVIADDC
jgi:hypothetical protein